MNRYYHDSLAHRIPNDKLLLDGYEEYLRASKAMKDGMLMYYAPQGFTSQLVKSGRARNGGNLLGLTDEPQICESIPKINHINT